MLTTGFVTLWALGACQEFSVDRQGQEGFEDPVGVVLDLVPAEHVFDKVCEEDEMVIALVNAGDEPVVVDDIDFDAQNSALRMSHRNPVPGPFEIPVGESAFVTITHRPSQPVANRGVLQIASNDPRGVAEAVQDVPAVDLSRADTFDPNRRRVDLLVAVDTTGSISGLHASGEITDGLSGLVSDLDRLGTDWKIGVVWGSDPCIRGPVDSTSKDPVADVAAAFPSAAAPENDQMFYMIDDALAETATGGCNAQFRRDDAALGVVLLSNSQPETDREWSEVGAGWTTYVDDCRELVVHALVNAEVYDNVTRPNPYIDAAESTGGVVINSPGKLPWATKWSQLGTSIAERARLLLLSSVPVPSSIALSVEDEAWSTGWSIDTELSAVRLVRPVPEGDLATVTYDIGACLPLECTF